MRQLYNLFICFCSCSAWCVRLFSELTYYFITAAWQAKGCLLCGLITWQVVERFCGARLQCSLFEVGNVLLCGHHIQCQKYITVIALILFWHCHEGLSYVFNAWVTRQLVIMHAPGNMVCIITLFPIWPYHNALRLTGPLVAARGSSYHRSSTLACALNENIIISCGHLLVMFK